MCGWFASAVGAARSVSPAELRLSELITFGEFYSNSNLKDLEQINLGKCVCF